MTQIITATQDHHKELVDLFKQEKCTSGFGNILYSGPEMYERGWIVEARFMGVLVGAYCVRHCGRKPQTSLYYIAVDRDYRRKGVATALIEHLKGSAPSGRIVLSVLLDNEPARAFYRRHGFVEAGPALAGKGVTMQWDL